MLTEDSQGLHPALHTVAVKDGFGGSTKCLNPALACKKIKEQAEAALKEDLAKAGIALPGEFVFEVSFKEHRDAVRRSFFPGFRLADDRTIVLETHDFMDVMRAVQFVL
jgi:D-amino peptidase